MLIKLPAAFSYARQRDARVARPLTRRERIKADRFVMALLFLLTIIGAAIFA